MSDGGSIRFITYSTARPRSSPDVNLFNKICDGLGPLVVHNGNSSRALAYSCTRTCLLDTFRYCFEACSMFEVENVKNF